MSILSVISGLCGVPVVYLLWIVLHDRYAITTPRVAYYKSIPIGLIDKIIHVPKWIRYVVITTLLVYGLLWYLDWFYFNFKAPFYSGILAIVIILASILFRKFFNKKKSVAKNTISGQ
jgi:hypothetical protein